MAITTTRVFPVTDGQVEAFSIWANNTYVTYDGYVGALNAPALDTYIRTHILPMEMKSILRETEPYIGVNHCDIHTQRLQLYRKRILKKIKYMKEKLGKLAFPVEAAQIRIDNRAAFINRRQSIVALHIQQQQYFDEYDEAVRLGLQFSPDIHPVIIPRTIVTKQLSKEDAESCVMDDDCVICLAMHKMTDACTINCGHQFGRKCIAKWKKDTCPLCRTTIKEITEYAEISLLNEVLLNEVHVLDQVIIS
jgi:hypothetical protein